MHTVLLLKELCICYHFSPFEAFGGNNEDAQANEKYALNCEYFDVAYLKLFF